MLQPVSHAQESGESSRGRTPRKYTKTQNPRLDKLSHKARNFYIRPAKWNESYSGHMFVELHTPNKWNHQAPIVFVHGDYHTGQVSSLPYVTPF